MLDIKFIRENVDRVKKATLDRGMDPTLVDRAIVSDKKYRELLGEVERLRAERNKVAKAKDVKRGKEIKSQLKKVDPKLKKAEEEYFQAVWLVPNIIADDVPVGKDEEENKSIRKWGNIPKFGFKPKDHVKIGKELDLIDTETSAKVSGSRFYYLKNDAVLLQFAIIQFVFETLADEKIIAKLAKKSGNPSKKPFIPVLPPVMIKADTAKRMDRFYPDNISYHLEKDDIVLVGSAEHSLGPMFMGDTLNAKDLPLRYIGYSTSFRREAGSYGKDMKGILRTHQFDKLEMESFTVPENGEVEQKFIVAIQEYLVQQLGIPYEIIYICTGDMGKADYRQYDVNCWLPGQNKYRETHTSDYMTDYQARRLNTRVRMKGGTEFVHMNDATAFAIGRTLIAILENYQQNDGSVRVPKVLQKWMGKSVIGK